MRAQAPRTPETVAAPHRRPAAGVPGLLGLQRRAGNAAVTALVRAETRPAAVQRCGAMSGPDCPCHDEETPVQRTGETAAPVVQRVDVTLTGITPDVARRMPDEELTAQLDRGNRHLPTVRDEAERTALRANLRILTEEQTRRRGGGAGVPRPPGLPLDGSYSLSALPAVPAEVADLVPEGRLVTITPEMLAPALGPQSAPPAAPVASSPASTVSRASTVAATPYIGLEANNLMYGLAPAGEHSIGVVSFPRWTPSRIPSGLSGPIPEHPVMWGHTAEIVRVNGRIVAVRSYAPASLLNAGLDIGTAPAPNLPAGVRPSVRAGTGSTPAAIYNDRLILLNTKLRSVEVAVTREMAEAAAAGLPPGEMYGLARGGAGQYTAQPSVFYGQGGAPGSCPNCVDWAVPNVEGQVGGRVATGGGVPITDIPPRAGGAPVPHAANQGRVHGALGGELQVVDAQGRPMNVRVATGGLSPGMQVLKWGGRIMLVVGVVSTGVEIYTAPPGEQGRTAAGALSGFAGGFAAGAAAGLICGPGALVCSVVAGGVLGTLGYLAARHAAEYAYDTATGRPRPPGALDQPAPQTTCPGVANCHLPNDARRGSGMPTIGLPADRELSEADRRRLLEYLRSVQR
ncbi:hypothetical protein [Lentzea sp. NPDC051838]|uniref:hypothetical protein n=1 Tax=Lentzea sp. NPDC051838 TaxID=3154849 RepID=UPI003449DAF0